MTDTQLETRIQELLEGSLDEAHWPALKKELENSSEALDLYCHHARIHSQLYLRAREIESLSNPTPLIPFEETVQENRNKTLRRAFLSAAALITIMAISLASFLVDKPAPKSTFETAPGSKFQLTHSTTEEETPTGYTLIEGSRLELTQGTIELTFDSGASSIITAPADITMLESDLLMLREGTAWFQVPENAVGFTVLTDSLKVVDLGTEFGVLSQDDHDDAVHVFKGRVEVSSIADPDLVITLRAGQARLLAANGQLEETDVIASSFLSSLPTSQPYRHFNFDDANEIKAEQFGVTGPEIASTVIPALDASVSPLKKVDGKFGNAVKLTGGIRTDWKGISGNTPRSLSFWVKFNDQSHKSKGLPLFGWGDRTQDDLASPETPSTASFYAFLNWTEQGDARIGFSGGRFWSTGTSIINDDKWHHIVFVYTGTVSHNGQPEFDIYVDGYSEKTTEHRNAAVKIESTTDGQLDTVTDSSTAIPLTFNTELWNNQEAGNGLNVSIDELFIFEFPLSLDQIETLHLENSP